MYDTKPGDLIRRSDLQSAIEEHLEAWRESGDESITSFYGRNRQYVDGMESCLDLVENIPAVFKEGEYHEKQTRTPQRSAGEG